MKNIYQSLRITSMFLLLLGSVSAFAQEKQTVKGTVKDATGAAMPFVNVVIKGTTTSAVTDVDGNFSIEASKDDVLQISFVSYKTQEIRVGEQTTINVSMEEDIKLLQEVVAVGYGQMKRSDLSSAHVSIGNADINRTVNTSIEQAIQGRAAGVTVTQNTGQPGGGISVNIRGISTLNGSSEPLYVIDGVQVNGQQSSYGTSSQSSAAVSTSPLSGINPTDIENIEILQGPSATAIYGSRATNGVVIVTTKRGKAGETKIAYNFTYSLQDTPAKLLPTMNLQQYATFYNTYASMGYATAIPEFADPSVLGTGTNWQSALFKQAPLLKHQISLSGGNDKTTYYLSAEYFNQAGVAVGSNFDRYSVRLNVDNQTRKWLKIGSNIMLSQTHDKVTTTNDQLIMTALQQSPNIAVTNPDGTWGGPTSTQFAITNPVALANINDNTTTRSNVMGGLNAEITLLKGLTFKNSVNGNLQYNTTNEWHPSYKFGGYVNSTSTLSKGSGLSYSWQINQLLQYNRKFGKHDLTLMTSHEAQASYYESMYASVSSFVTNDVKELGGASQFTQPLSNNGAWSMESYMGRVNYVYNDKYILMGNIRADGSSNFGPSNKWGVFPSVSAAWRIGQESFLRDVKQINDLKIRGEVGLTGNQAAPQGAYLSQLKTYLTPWGTSYAPNNYSNPSLKWENTLTYNLGFNISLLNNRIEFIGDAYFRKTDNLLMQVTPPAFMGAYGEGNISAAWSNVGALQNKGIALTLNTVNIEKPFLWKSSFNFSLNRNKVTALYGSSDIILKTRENFQQITEVGQPVWQFYGYQSLGLIQNSTQATDPAVAVPEANRYTRNPNHTWVGDVLYKDQNGDSVINAKDLVTIGNPLPAFTFGITNTFAYKNFELSIFMQGSVGNDIFNYVKFKFQSPDGSSPGSGRLAGAANYAQLATGADGVTYIENSGTNVPRISGSDPNGNATRPTQTFVENGSYLRLKNIQLSYNVPNAVLSKFTKNTVSNLKLSFGVQNLFTITSYSGYDPEIGSYVGNSSQYAGGNVIGIDYGRYPLTRMYTFNLAVNF